MTVTLHVSRIYNRYNVKDYNFFILLYLLDRGRYLFGIFYERS